MIQEANTDEMVALESSAIVDQSFKNDNTELLIGTSGGEQVVYSFHVASLDENFIYHPQPAKDHGVSEATITEAVPLNVAKK